MKKLIIFTAIALSFSSISPVFASDITALANSDSIQESVPNVLPTSENVLNVLPQSQDIESTTSESTHEVMFPSLPTPVPSGHLPTVTTNFENTEEGISVTPPCPTICPGPQPIIVTIDPEEINSCEQVIVPTLKTDEASIQLDRLILPENPCPPITPVIQETSSGSGGGSIIFPTNVPPVIEPVIRETSIEVPGQKVLGEQKVVMEKSTSPSFPKTGAAPITPRVPSTSNTSGNTAYALTIYSCNNDRKEEYSIV